MSNATDLIACGSISIIFKQIEGGVEMTDIVHYKIPLWILGDLANRLFVKAQLQEIFRYRVKLVTELFGEWPDEKQPTAVLVEY